MILADTGKEKKMGKVNRNTHACFIAVFAVKLEVEHKFDTLTHGVCLSRYLQFIKSNIRCPGYVFNEVSI